MNLLKIIIEIINALFKKNEQNAPMEQPIVETPVMDSPVDEEEEKISEDLVLSYPQPKSNVKILIDNGHGNTTSGKRSPWSANKVSPEIEFYEYKWNREIAEEVVNELVTRGYDAELLVSELKDISLTERVNRINKFCSSLGAKNVIMVSIHANAAGNGAKWMNGRGWSAYTTKGKTNSDDLAEALYAEAEKNFEGLKIRCDKSDGDKDYEENFTIIYGAKCPAVLTENFFYDNVDDVKYILSDEGRKQVIKTHVDGIIRYLDNKGA